MTREKILKFINLMNNLNLNNIKNIIKIINDKNYNIVIDNSKNNVDAQIRLIENNEIEIRINSKSKKEIEYLIIHEVTHAIDTKEMQYLVLDYVNKHNDFNMEVNEIENSYKIDDITSEIVAIVAGILFGNQKFIDHLTLNNSNILKRIYKKVISLLNKITHNSYRVLFIQELKYKWEDAYRNTTYEQAVKNINNGTLFSIQQDSNGNNYVNVDTNQTIFEGIKLKDYNKIAKMYINDYLKGETYLANNDVAIIDSKSASKYTNPGKKQPNFYEKMKLVPELKNILEISEKTNNSLPTKDTSKYSKWEYYKFNFKIKGNSFSGIVNIGIDSKGIKHFYEVNNIKKTAVYRMFHRIDLLVFLKTI